LNQKIHSFEETQKIDEVKSSEVNEKSYEEVGKRKKHQIAKPVY
jgi:hypothetical protein